MLDLLDDDGVVVETAESIELKLESSRELTLLTLFTNRDLLNVLADTFFTADTLPYVRE